MFEVFVHKEVLKFVEKLPVSNKKKFWDFIEEARVNPLNIRKFDIKIVVDVSPKTYRLRTGKYRFFFRVDFEKKKVYVIHADLRGRSTYRRAGKKF